MKNRLPKYTAVGIGPGLGTNDDGKMFYSSCFTIITGLLF